MKKKRSQIMAVILAVLNTVIIIPAVLLLASSAFLVLMVADKASTSDRSVIIFIFGIWILAAVGFVQYGGYIWHSFRLLSPKISLILWISTIIYNVSGMILGIIIAVMYFRDVAETPQSIIYFIVQFMIFISTICLSIAALKDDLAGKS